MMQIDPLYYFLKSLCDYCGDEFIEERKSVREKEVFSFKVMRNEICIFSHTCYENTIEDAIKSAMRTSFFEMYSFATNKWHDSTIALLNNIKNQ